MRSKKSSLRKDISPRQAQVLECVKASFFARGIAPTYREIAKQLGIRSYGSAAKYVMELVKKGYLKKLARYRARSIFPDGVSQSHLATQVTVVAPDGTHERLWLVGRTTVVTKDGTKVQVATPGFHQGPPIKGGRS